MLAKWLRPGGKTLLPEAGVFSTVGSPSPRAGCNNPETFKNFL